MSGTPKSSLMQKPIYYVSACSGD